MQAHFILGAGLRTGPKLWRLSTNKVETPIHDNIRELVTWECKEHGVKS